MPKKAKQVYSDAVMHFFFYNCAVTHYAFALQGQTVNLHYYIHTWTASVRECVIKRPVNFNNTPSHLLCVCMNFWLKQNDHPSHLHYSSDLALYGFFIFPEHKTVLNRMRIIDVTVIKAK